MKNITLNKKPIYDYLRKNHLTLQQLAKSIGTSRSTLYRGLNGRYNMKTNTLAKLLVATHLQDATVGEVFSLSKTCHKCDKEGVE